MPALSRTLLQDLHPTRWSLVRRTRQTGQQADVALDHILGHYWYPLYAFARHRGMNEEDAADGVQGFMAHACATHLLAKAEEHRGRLRSWMLNCFQNFLAGQRHRASALKRGGDAQILSIDWPEAEALYLSEPALSESPDAIYARTWAESLMEEALQQLSNHYAKTGRSDLYEAILPALESPLPDQTFAGAAARFDMTSGALRSATQRMRNRYRSILLDLAASRLGITSEAALHDELRSLLRPR